MAEWNLIQLQQHKGTNKTPWLIHSGRQREGLECVRAEMLYAKFVLVRVSGCYTLSACKQVSVL